MKNFIHRMQEAGRKAAELKQVIQGAPAQAAALRESVAMTANELHQLRSDVQSNLTGLRAQNEQHLLEAMNEIDSAAQTLEEAGYHLSGLDLDLALNQKLSVELERIGEVAEPVLRQLVAKETRRTLKSILTGIMRAEETARKVRLQDLEYLGLTVNIGPTPAIRMCWRPQVQHPGLEHAVLSATTSVPLSSSAFAPPPVPSATKPSHPEPAKPAQAFGSFFEPRAYPSHKESTPTSSPAHATATVSKTTATLAEKPVVEPGGWGADALDRFKKMPNVSRHTR